MSTTALLPQGAGITGVDLRALIVSSPSDGIAKRRTRNSGLAADL